MLGEEFITNLAAEELLDVPAADSAQDAIRNFLQMVGGSKAHFQLVLQELKTRIPDEHAALLKIMQISDQIELIAAGMGYFTQKIAKRESGRRCIGNSDNAASGKAIVRLANPFLT